MADFTSTTTVDASPDDLFAFLSDVGNLPRYFARMTSAESTGGNAVRTSAELPDGSHVEGEAWFDVDPEAQHIAWGAEGSNDYHGHLDVRPAEHGATVEVHIHTGRVEPGDHEVQNGVDETLDRIRTLVEEQHVAG
ncbi:SRPBCC family protein [Actinomycetospora soli]|uniref:SRPBCC family protein n=1 Tax=Actinomycetospora soli TaxID=2893887 RepID=UPI001E5934CE|nr:SRPBCC family protein [Actinomycetospora soli]MCD2186872.1 SRPBCC family protein [Actinomycetospora soli]